MIIATHEMTFASEVADLVCFLESGRIVESGPPEQLFSAPARPETQRFLARVLMSRALMLRALILCLSCQSCGPIPAANQCRPFSFKPLETLIAGRLTTY